MPYKRSLRFGYTFTFKNETQENQQLQFFHILLTSKSRFLAWFEDHPLAVAIAPDLPRGATSGTPTNLSKILEWMG
jgi:hypothetical protein